MQQDLLLKRYLSDNERYADLLNGFAFRGRQIVKASDLTELDSQTGFHAQHTGGIRSLPGKKSKKSAKYRDMIRKTVFGINFAVVGLENQQEVHYLMPLRTMDYDVEEYNRQAAIIRRRVRKRQDITRAEFLSGFTRQDKLHPCVTIVLFYGEEWDGSYDLHGVLDFTDIPEAIRSMVNNYSINLLHIKRLQDTSVFKTDLRQVFDFIRFSKDKDKLRQLVENDDAYREMDETAYDVAVGFTRAHELVEVKKYHDKEGKIDMCQALTEMLQDEREEGRAEGHAAGREQGRLEMLVKLVKGQVITIAVAAQTAEMSVEEFKLVCDRAQDCVHFNKLCDHVKSTAEILPCFCHKYAG